ncbi:MAG: hypothetical protein EG825_12865 [Rhodocyclaceae bacterium]|nr:hypothetical protein [Rhodocyclaceae bacterium]
MGVDDGPAILEQLISSMRDEPTLNEADTRFRMIDTLFFDCLGWPKDSVNMEERFDGTYADYTFLRGARVAVLEAKREGQFFELPSDTRTGTLSLRAIMTGSGVETAVRQAMGYCQERGVPIGIVSNGRQLVAFVAARSDGVSPLDGRAVVYPSLQELAGRWTEFWNYFSPGAFERSSLQNELLGVRVSALPGKLSGRVRDYPGIKNRNPFQTDLQIVAELVIEDVIRNPQLEETFLEQCYCKSGALSQYSLLSKNVLRARYAALAADAKVSAQPAVTKRGLSDDLLADSIKKRPTLLIGDVGVGKTMFVRHLIKVDAKDVLEHGITLYVDMGSQATLTTDLRDFVPREMARQLKDDYGVDVNDRGFVTAVYQTELHDFDNGIYGELQGIDPSGYLAKRLELLGGLIERPHDHLARALDHIVKGRRQQVVLFLDNVDQRDEDTQQQSFLVAHEMAERWPLTVFLALRPTTFHKSVRDGALTGYHPKAFTISPPRIVDVIGKRLDFALRLSKGELEISAISGAMALPTLTKVIEAFAYSLIANRDLACCIDNISAGNVRSALEQVRDFFGSGHVDTQKMVGIMDEQGHYTVPVHEFLRATLYGDAVHYDPTQSTIPNLFDVTEPDKREHFIVLLLLAHLQSLGRARGGDESVEVMAAVELLQDCGFTPAQAHSAIRRSLNGKLIDSAASGDSPGELPYSIRITSLGAYCIEYLAKLFTYVDAIIVDTPILDSEIEAKINDERDIAGRLTRAETFLDYLDSCWRLVPSESECPLNWNGVSAALRSDIAAIKRRACPSPDSDGADTVEQRFRPDIRGQ